ncbi:hypothetical protein VTL71DRAFT_15152 [Oculimacula yallundae]|uniref:Uncharacterized protein n=1 Tax=Oculimacula yallundae TaxID=86028 RepID=A0ABR4CFS5_9HELO
MATPACDMSWRPVGYFERISFMLDGLDEPEHTDHRVNLAYHAYPIIFENFYTGPVWSSPALDTDSHAVFPAMCPSTNEQDVSSQDPMKPDLAFLMRHLREGRLTEQQALHILEEEGKLLKQYPYLLKNAPITVCRDVYGQYYDLMKLFEVSGSHTSISSLLSPNLHAKEEYPYSYESIHNDLFQRYYSPINDTKLDPGDLEVIWNSQTYVDTSLYEDESTREWGSLGCRPFRASIDLLFDRDYVWAATQTMVSIGASALWALFHKDRHKAWAVFHRDRHKFLEM